MQDCKINVLGSEYKIIFKNDEEVCKDMDMPLGDCGGYCNAYDKKIVIANLDKCNESEESKRALQIENMRHEIIHAFLNESGLMFNANAIDCWARNEEMVDWFAIQSPKIFKIFKDMDLL